MNGGGRDPVVASEHTPCVGSTETFGFLYFLRKVVFMGPPSHRTIINVGERGLRKREEGERERPQIGKFSLFFS